MKSRGTVVIGAVTIAAALLGVACEGYRWTTTTHAQSVTRRVWVIFKPSERKRVEGLLRHGGATVHHAFDDLDSFVVSIPARAVEALSSNAAVERVVEDTKRSFLSETRPYGIEQVQASDVWDSNPADGQLDVLAPDGTGVPVCVLDSGVWKQHTDLSGTHLFTGGMGGDRDPCGHGTHTVGTIAARVGNGRGVQGVSPGVDIFMRKLPTDSTCEGVYTSSVVSALQDCVTFFKEHPFYKTYGKYGVVHIGVGRTGAGSTSAQEEAMVERIYAGGGILVAPAGNDESRETAYPAGYESVISVGAVDDQNVIASFSNHNTRIELVAPGVGVLSTVPWYAASELTVDGTSYESNRMEGSANGSVTAPLVAGDRCEVTGSWAGAVVLCERGNISFADKVLNVQAGGGVAAVIYNNESGALEGTLGETQTAIPSIGLSDTDGQSLLANKLGSTVHVSAVYLQNASGTDRMDGTSMAAAHVTGVVALVWSYNPGFTNDDIRNALTATALDLGNLGRDDYYGYGLVQADDALTYLTTGQLP